MRTNRLILTRVLSAPVVLVHRIGFSNSKRYMILMERSTRTLESFILNLLNLILKENVNHREQLYFIISKEKKRLTSSMVILRLYLITFNSGILFTTSVLIRIKKVALRNMI